MVLNLFLFFSSDISFFQVKIFTFSIGDTPTRDGEFDLWVLAARVEAGGFHGAREFQWFL